MSFHAPLPEEHKALEGAMALFVHRYHSAMVERVAVAAVHKENAG